MTWSLTKLSKQIWFSHLRVTLAPQSTLFGYQFAGSMLHGALINALNVVDPKLCQTLLTAQDGSHPRAYFFIAPYLPKGEVIAQQPLSFEIKLFGHACEYLGAVVQSLFELQAIGLGNNRVPFSITHIELGSQGRWLTLFQRRQNDLLCPPQTTLADQLYTPFTCLAKKWHVRVETRSPLALTRSKNTLNSAPNLADLLFFIGNRLRALCDHFHSVDFSVMALLPKIEQQPSSPNTHFFVQKRHPDLAEKNHDLRGITGSWYYAIDASLIPWLQLGAALQVGKSANYGQGAYLLSWGILSE